METKELGKIQSVKYGMGGYQDCMLGLSFVLGGESWGVGDFWLSSEQDRIRKLLSSAKKNSVDELVGTPVEVTFENSVRKSWRVLKEVL